MKSSRITRVETVGKLVRRIVGGAVLRTAALALVLFFGAFLTQELGGDPTVLLVLGVVLPAVWLLGELLLPRTTQLGGGSELLVGQAAAADGVYAATFQSLRSEHAVPALIHARRVRVGKPAAGVRNVLRLRMGFYRVTAAISPFGNDLHLTWRLTRRHVPLATIFRWLVAQVAVDTGYLDLIEVEPARALGEAVRQAMQAGAAKGPLAPGESLVTTFESDLQVEQADHRSSA